jgi:hypothetical protein
MSEILPTPMTSSQRLLLALLSSKPAQHPSDQEEIRWNDFLRLAGGIGLAPFIAHVLQEDPRGFPDSVREQILASGRANAMRQLRRHAALKQIAGALDEARSPFIVLKGMALAYLAYPNPYCRSMSDIDLFVPRAELSRAVQAARDSGLVESRLSFRQECPAFASPDRLVHIEIHGSIPSMEEFGVDSATLWKRSLSADLGGIQVRVLCPEDFVQHLCLHIGPHHNYLSRLQELLDFRFYLEKHGAEMDWQAVSDRSVQIGSSAWVFLTLWLAQELLGAPVPAAFFQSCHAPKRLGDLSRVATQHLLSLSDLPMTSSFVKACAGGSFKERLGALAEHWRTAGSRVLVDQSPREAEAVETGDYLWLFLLRMRFLARSGALRRSAWKAAAEYQVSRAALLKLMDGEAQVFPPNPPAA